MPDFKTIADFRKDNGPAIRAVCTQFVILCRRWNLFTPALKSRCRKWSVSSGRFLPDRIGGLFPRSGHFPKSDRSPQPA